MNFETTQHKWRGIPFLKLAKDNIPTHINYDLADVINKINIKGKNVIDGGSNIGLHSVFFSKCVGEKGTVYAFELQPIIYQLGIGNAELNGVKNIIHHNAALSNKSDDLVGFTYIDYSWDEVSSGGIRTEPELRGQPHCGEIKTISIDDLNIENVVLIKLDLEGNEPKALDGMWNTIDKWKPYLIIELSIGYLGDGQQETIDKIVSHGYEVTELGDFNYFFKPLYE